MEMTARQQMLFDLATQAGSDDEFWSGLATFAREDAYEIVRRIVEIAGGREEAYPMHELVELGRRMAASAAVAGYSHDDAEDERVELVERIRQHTAELVEAAARA